MLLSLALVFLCGMAMGKLFELIKLPSLVGMLLTGILLGPSVLNLIDGSVIGISSELRQIALIIILARAGMNINIEELKQAGKAGVLLCFVPACLEIAAVAFLAPPLLGISSIEAVLLGTVIAAVSPAVIVPRMLNLMEKGYGKKHSVPQTVMAGASVDDVFVIVLFTVLLGLAETGVLQATQFLQIPTSIVFGIGGGVLVGLVLCMFFSKIHVRDSAKIVIVLSISFLLVSLENSLSGAIGFSGLLCVMTVGIVMKLKKQELATRLSGKFSKLWVAAEIMLFVLVGASVNLQYALYTGANAVILIFAVLAFRVLGVMISLINSKFSKKERLFVVVSYLPKATVQAAIGGVPLAIGLACGNIVLSVAVISILITAPLGAILIDKLYKKLLTKD